ncbi:MAG TPA: 50S ribosomal protein L10 [Actinomycetota bacterium]|nr:50S ribosomal protein L10 [Actinomycetota bacterium]
MARPEKTQAVEEISGRFQEASAALLTEYRGLSVSDIAELRGALREADAEYKVLKNTLTRIAVKDVGLEDLIGLLEGPTAIAFCKGDAVAAAKALDEAAKKYPVLVIKGGVLRGKVIDATQAKALASLEPREIQLAKIVMMFNAPLQQTVNVFAASLRDLGSMLGQVLAKKESGELPGGTGEAAPPAEAAAPEPEAEAPADEAASAEPTEGDEPADRGQAGTAEAVAETETETAGEVAEAVEASNETDDQDSSTSDTAEGGDEKEE